MTWIDTLFIGIIGFSVVISLFRGFIREALSLVTWGMAIWVAIVFSSSLATKLQTHIASSEARFMLAFLILLLAVPIIGGIIGHLVGKLITATGLSGTDRLLGIFFGFARGVLLVAGIVLVVNLTQFKSEAWWTGARLVPYFNTVAAWLMDYIPQLIDQNKDNKDKETKEKETPVMVPILKNEVLNYNK